MTQTLLDGEEIVKMIHWGKEGERGREASYWKNTNTLGLVSATKLNIGGKCNAHSSNSSSGYCGSRQVSFSSFISALTRLSILSFDRIARAK